MITKELITKIARLAHLHTEEAEVQELSADLSSIFDYIALLEKVDISAVEPLSHVLAQTNVMRPDIAEPSLPVDDLLGIAPDTSGRFIKVPIIVEPGTEH